jgi:flagellar biosynthesis anti-sigma factor FlgM
MKIDPEHLPKVGKDPTRVGGPAKRAPVRDSQRQDAAQAPDTSRSDGLTLSRGADRFRQLRARLESLPEPQQSERLAQLKALVDSGQYKVEGEKIARAMLADEATASALGLGPSG